MTPTPADRFDQAARRFEAAGMASETVTRWRALGACVLALPPALVAYSGGVDSSFLAYTLHLAQGIDMLAVTARTGLDTAEQLHFAISFACQHSIPHEILEFDALQLDAIRANPPERCFYCKQAVLLRLHALARERGYAAVVEGQNWDDERDYRPGRRAVAETGTLSPLVTARLTKADIRALSQGLGLAVWNRPSSPCLATRFPYGVEITPPALSQVATAERLLHEMGFDHVRVRWYAEMARIEIAPEQIEHLVAARAAVLAALKPLGFHSVAVDLQGYRQGSLNEGLNL